MKVQWIIAIILIVLIAIAVLFLLFSWMRKSNVQVIRPIESGEVIVTGGKSTSRIGSRHTPPTSHSSQSSGGVPTYRQILGKAI